MKLEVLGEAKTLYPDMHETLRATEVLANEGFKPMVYCVDDPIAAKRLENAGRVVSGRTSCASAEPLPVGIGRFFFPPALHHGRQPHRIIEIPRGRSGGPAAASPARAADAPGTGWTRTPASRAALTSLWPGSETSGVPASLTSASDAPP